jgi:hypothetical protein
MKLTIELPNIDADELSKTELTTVQIQKAKEAVAAHLYGNGIFSEKEACDLAGLTRRDFENMLPDYGFSILLSTPENIAIETNQK